MRAAALAIAWEFRQRHRWGFIGITVFLLIVGAFKLVDFDDAQLAAFAILPMTAAFLYFLAVFSFGLTGDLAARQSMYPARAFTLPLTTNALVAWPMLYGTTAMVVLWFAIRLLGFWPASVRVPVLWPALLAASLLAWTQALTWMPYPLRGLRVLVTVLWLVVIDAIVIMALELEASEPVMLALLAPHVPLAYVVARLAVARARRGDVPDWPAIAAPFAVSRRRADFRSAARAQLWLEWRQHGRSLPLLVAIVVPCELSLLFLFSETPVIVFEVLAVALLTPAFLATFVAATVSGGVTPFLATRPVTNASLIAAKLKVTMASTLLAWLLVGIAVPLAVRLSGAADIVSDGARRVVEGFGVHRAVALAVLVIAFLAASTWKQLVQSLYIGMSGRPWLVKASVFLSLTFVALLLPLAHWIAGSRAAIAALWDALPWILVALVCLKLSAASFVAMRLYDHRLLNDRALMTGAATWTALVFALYGVLRWMVPEILVRSDSLVLIAILAIPLARLSAAPLALAWNRHR